MDEQLRLTDLIPRRLPIFAILLVVGLAMVVGLEILYAWMPELSARTTDGRVAALDLDGEGSLAVWFSSFVLLLAAAMALVVYSVRRHRQDDYQGYYRIWLWAAACWMLMSIDETSSLHEGFKEMMVWVTGARVFGDGSIWWVAAYGFLLGAVGSRLLLDMRECRLSASALVTAAGCYVLAVVAQLGWILPESGARGVMLEEGAEMIGNLMLLLAMGLHARYVILDAEGLLPERERTRVGESGEDEEDQMAVPSPAPSRQFPIGIGRSARVDPPHPAPQPAAAPASQPVAMTGSPASAPVQRKLTKAEKRALRQRLLQKRRLREQQG